MMPFEQVLLQHVSWFGQQFRRAVQENHAHPIDSQGNDMVRADRFELFGGEVRQTLAAVNGCPISGSASSTITDKPSRGRAKPPSHLLGQRR